ncbi:salicylate esterase [Paraburkholderia sabiae]|uniref:alpha/beta fold hydrolase n=1 Tax=Paraburkholderia sabiae TaxID=273251 RepID=UPI001CAE8CA1|nr:alpha/beta fold hydrolase [Paraburkholderia sabiae]CAG9192071.1 salicylate esterase [Paraburkholderia sabiae]
MEANKPLPTSQPRPHESTGIAKTYLLVHGAYHGAWCWKEVARQLRMDGHTVYTPTLTGLGERSHLLSFRPTLETFIEDIAQVIRFEELSELILVGHSFAGPVISAIADRMPERIRHLVFLDALVLHANECAADRSPPERMALYRQRANAANGGLGVPPVPPEYFGVVDPAISEWLATKLTPHPVQTYEDRLTLLNALGNDLPATYIACTKPPHPTTVKSRELARNQTGWRYLELPTSHDAMITMPVELAGMLAAVS